MIVESEKWALVTGATAGIGEATCQQLAKNGFSIAMIGRRENRLRELSEKLVREFGVEVLPLALDVSDRKQVEQKIKDHSEIISKIEVLVNNAGLAAGADLVDEASIDDWEQMIDVNIKGLLYITRLLLKPVIENQGDIVNIGSVAGKYTYRGGAVYCATKFAVKALNEGMRLDLLGKNVRVTNISPGMVETEFSEVRFGSKEKADNVYKGMTPLTAKDIAESIVWCLDRPKHVNIQELVIYPTDQASVHSVHRN